MHGEQPEIRIPARVITLANIYIDYGNADFVASEIA